jgi:hypothetical protein
MGKRELRLAKLHRHLAVAQAENRRLEENIQRLHNLLREPPKLTPFADLVVTSVKRMDHRRHFDEWMVTHRFCPDAFSIAILDADRNGGLLNVSAMAAEISRYMEYDIRKAIFDAVSKQTGGFAR